MHILAKGDSMYPTIVDGKTYVLKPIGKEDIGIDDIIVYYKNDVVICHRVVRIIRSGLGQVFVQTKGDNCDNVDSYVVPLDFIIGKIDQ